MTLNPIYLVIFKFPEKTSYNSLIVRFKNKDEKAFEHLYQLYSDRLRHIIFRMVKDKIIAEELLHDTFVKAWNNSKNYSLNKGRFFT